jgi:hypothetical protein
MPTILPDTAPALFGHDGLSGLRQQDPAKALGEAVGTAHVHVAPKHTPLDRLLARAEQRSIARLYATWSTPFGPPGQPERSQPCWSRTPRTP